MATHSWIPVVVVLVAGGIGAVTDIWRYRVYNVLTFPLIFSGILYHGIVGGWTGVSDSLAGALFGFAVLALPYLLGLMGAGDVKLLTGVGAWLGLYPTAIVFVASSLITGVVAVGMILYRGRLLESWIVIKLIFYRFAALGMHFGKEDLVEDLSTGPDRRLRVIPFGAMIPLGIIGALMWFNWFRGM